MKFIVNTLIAATALTLALCLPGCGSALSGTWSGKVTPKAGAASAGKGYSETKPSLSCSLTLQGNGKYEANMQEVRSTGSWKTEGPTLTLTPETYMGMSKEQLSGGNKGKATSVDGIFADYVLKVAPDQKSMVHDDSSGVTIYSR